MLNLIPKPSAISTSAEWFTLSSTTKILIANPDAEVSTIANYLAGFLEQHTHLKLAIVTEMQGMGNIELKLNDDASLGEEGYELFIQTEAFA